MSLLDLSDKVAVVTGSSRGIGLAIAGKLAAHGANIVLCGRSDGSVIKQAAESMKQKFGVDIATCTGDIGLPETAQQIAKTAFSKFKRLDILVNNAGVLHDSLIGMIADDDIENTLAANVKGVLYGIQSCARLMERKGGGSIINLASIIGRVGNKGQLVYGASKAAVIGATYSAAKELASKSIRVNAIAPGYIDTDMIQGIDAETDHERRESIGMGRIGTTDDIANTALFLASDLSDYVTGQVIGVDGGMLI